MPYTIDPQKRKQEIPSFNELWAPIYKILINMAPLEARGYRPLQMNFEQQLKALILYHLEEHSSGRHLLQVLEEDDFARNEIAPPEGIKKSSFFEAINSRGLEQLLYVFQKLQADAARILPKEHSNLGDTIVFYDAIVLLGTPNVNQTEKPVRVVGYRAQGKEYWVATDRYDLTAEEIACVYKLRWNIEIFFGWWKRHLKVYHLIARTQYGLMVQMLAGLITYLLLTIYCHNNYNEKVSIKRVRELRIKIRNEAHNFDFAPLGTNSFKKQKKNHAYAKT